MRTREEIVKHTTINAPAEVIEVDRAILEVLLDIRDLLTPSK